MDTQTTGRLVARGLDERYQRLSQRQLNEELESLWLQLQRRQITGEECLEKIVDAMDPHASNNEEFNSDTVDDFFFYEEDE